MSDKAMTSWDDLERLLRPHHQDHLLRFWDELDNDGRQQLAAQINAVPWDLMDQWIEDYVLTEPELEIAVEELEPAPYYPLKARTEQECDFYDRAEQRGHELLAAGKVAGFAVAGGQGTRLGYDGPKGTFPISPIKNKTLFQLFAETIQRAQEKYEISIPWFIMTSPVNDQATRDFFAAQGYFGLASNEILFMVQDVLPAIGLDGKLLLAAKDSLALSPNGHGGSFPALRDSGALDLMRARDIEYISYWQVDNPLVHLFDPLFLGMHDLLQSEMSCRALVKRGPSEKLGNFCRYKGKTVIVEYSDMPEKLATAVDDEGQLRFRAGSPAIHILNRAFAERLTGGGKVQLPLHRAVKKVAHVDEQGREISPEQPNAVKLEMFIFDGLPKAREVLILEADRKEQFGPVKNATGEDSPATSQALLVERSARWLEQAGVQMPRNADGSLDCVIELSPRRFMDQRDLAEKADKFLSPEPGETKYYG